MKLIAFVAAAFVGAASFASAQTTTTKIVTVDGEVVRYEPGRLIVVRGADSRETTYTLSPSISIPTDVQVGRRVTLYTEPGAGGNASVSRVVTTSVTPEGQVKRTTEETRVQPSGSTTRTTTTEISGKVEAYAAGKTITILRADGTKATYVISGQSQVPTDLVIGKTVTIVPLGNGQVAQTVTYTLVNPQP